ncbi:hypothetical protein [Sphingobium aromaticiconvertens]|uniref:hypothetical protein n=1 Tax=Sphingobium aromaticiconvertens TaxID=365341 RepID=UPI003018AD7C
MFDEFDRAYYQRRAGEEREKAASTENISAKRTREELAKAYERKIEALDHSLADARR